MRKMTVIGMIALSLVASTAAYAGPGCRSHEAAKTSAGCSYSSDKTASLDGLEIETTRLPSGAMLVFYTSANTATIKTLQASAETGVQGFDCRLCKKIAGDLECTIELAAIDTGVVALVVAEETATVDAYEKQFAALVSTTETDVN